MTPPVIHGPAPAAGGFRDGRPSLLRTWGPAWAVMAAIFAASSLSQPPAAAAAVDDGVWHGLGYGLLAALLLRGLAAARLEAVTGRAALLAAALATSYGVTDELHQWFVPGRTAEWSDLAADAAGAAAASGAGLWGARVARGRREPERTPWTRNPS